MISGWRVRAARLIASAAVFHLLVTLTIYLIGRFALLPRVFDVNGTGMFFATDSFVYRAETISLTGILTRDGMAAWLATPAPFHVRLYSLSFAAFGPVLGFNVLSAEPINLLSYLATLILIFKLGQEVFDRRVGLLAAVMVALWPSMLLHTTQLLRDSLFIAAMLGLVLVMVRWLTRDYTWRGGLGAGLAGGMIAVALWALRINMWGVVPAIVLFGTVMFVIRLIHERRMMKGNLVGVLTMLTLIASIPVFVPRPVYFMTQPNGAPLVETRDLPPAAVGAPPLAAPPDARAPNVWSHPGARIGYERAGFKRQYPEAGSNIDPDAQFNSLGDVIRYLPRALSIGLFAPFQNMWFVEGERVGLSGRLLSGVETLAMYFIELLALVGLWQSRQRLSVWLLLLIALACVTALGIVVLNVAALYRMRYVFWMLLILLGARGLIKLVTIARRERAEQNTALKVCYILDTAVGAAWAYEQLRELRNRYGFHVTAFVTNSRGSLVDKLRSEGIPCHVWNFGSASLIGICALPFKVLGLARLLRRERFDVVQTHLFRSMVIGRLAAWLADVPVRLAMVAGPYHLEAHTLRWIDRSTCWMDTALIASCEYTRQLYRRMGVADVHLELIYYGPDESRFDPERFPPASIREEYGWSSDTPLVGMVAYFYPPWRSSGLTPPSVNGRGIKGHEYLIKAAPSILAEFPQAKLLLIGSAFNEDGQRYMDELKALVRRSGLQDSIIFTGFRADINNVLRALDVSAQPSLNENLGGTIESLLMECPLVATRVGGMVDSVLDGETGVLVEPANADELARAILQLLRDPERARRLGRAGRKLMLERFTLSHTVRDLRDLYHRLLRRDEGARRQYRLWVSCCRLIALAPVAAYLALRMTTEIYTLRVWDAIRAAR